MPKAATMHPNYKVIEVSEPNGNKYKVRSTYPHSVLNADISPDQHPAWTGKTGASGVKSDKVDNFQKKYGMMDFAAVS